MAGTTFLVAIIVTLTVQTVSVMAASHVSTAPAVPNGCDESTYRIHEPYGFSWCPDGGYVTQGTGYVAPGSPDFNHSAPPNPVGCPGNPGTPDTTAYCSDGSYVVDSSVDSVPEAENSVFDGDLGFPRVSASQGQLTNVLGTVFMLTGALASVFIVVGGLRYVIAAGNPEGVQKAKNTVLYAVIGLVISIFAFTIVNFVISNV